MKTRKADKLDLVTAHIHDDGQFPNNDALAVLLYRDVLSLPFFRSGPSTERFLRTHDWSNTWRGTIYDYNHYHSNTHELMAVMRGEAEVLVGGEKGVQLHLKKGDVIIIPAGVAHKLLKSDSKFRIIGAYPGGREYDMKLGKKDERPDADRNILQVPLPKMDPIYGQAGPLKELWKRSA